nr:hypothetical protein Q903MT_gene3279 [Picea sitchensis]
MLLAIQLILLVLVQRLHLETQLLPLKPTTSLINSGNWSFINSFINRYFRI